MVLKSLRIVDFGEKSSGFADLKNTVDRGSAESFGPVSGFCQSRSSDCGFYIFSRATLNETFTAKYGGVLPRTP